VHNNRIVYLAWISALKEVAVEKPIVTGELPLEEDEVAAAIGAVMHILANQSRSHFSEKKESLWARVSRLEATSGSSIASLIEARHLLIDTPIRSVRQWGGHDSTMPREYGRGRAVGTGTSRSSLAVIGFSLSLFLWANCASPAKAWWIFKHHRHASDGVDDSSQTAPSPPAVLTPLRSPNYQNSSSDRHFQPTSSAVNQTRPNQAPSNPLPGLTPPLGIPTAPDRQASFVINPSKLTTSTIRVGLATGANTAEIVALDGASLKEYGSAANLATLAPQTRWSLKLERKSLVLTPRDWFQLAYHPSREFQSGSYRSMDSRVKPAAYRVSEAPRFDPHSFNRLALRLSLASFNNDKTFMLIPNSVDGQPGLFAINGKFYRGNLIVLPQSALAASGSGDASGQGLGFNLINEIDLDDYLLGVVPSEMPSSWPLEALKAQAIAARTYALANLGKHGKDGYDLKDTTDDQVYSGVKAESSASNAAVAATDGVVMTYEGNPICAYFHSASGGITESAENVWGKPLPYLRAVMDYDQQSPLSTWNRTFSVDQLESALASDIGKLLSIDVVSRSQSRRACQLLVSGSRGAQITNAETVRRLLKLPSTNFNVSVLDNAYLFSGRGFGHGLGLSQWGAKGLAEQGYNAAQILTYYYRNVSLERIVDVPNH
jgi:SpoIID/LytB domain protein